MTAYLNTFRQREDGAALVEFAIVVPLLMLIMFTIIGWGYSLSLLDAMYDVARTTAREVSVGEITSQNAAEAAILTNLANWEWNSDASRGFYACVRSDGNDIVVQVAVAKTNNFFADLAFIPVLPPLEAEAILFNEQSVTLPATCAEAAPEV